MFQDATKLRNVVDLRSVIILVRKIESFYIDVRPEFWKEALESKDLIKIVFKRTPSNIMKFIQIQSMIILRINRFAIPPSRGKIEWLSQHAEKCGLRGSILTRY